MLICLDYDGVLVDTFDQLLAMMVQVQAELGLGRVPVEVDLRSIEQLTFDSVARRIGLQGDDVARFGAGMFARQSQVHSTRVYPGIDTALRSLAGGHTLVVVTANHSDAVSPVLERHGLSALIEALYGSEGGQSKSARIDAARRSYRFSKVDTVMVGDALSDLHAGREAGVLVAAATWGYQPRERLAVAAPDAWLDAPGDLCRLPGLLRLRAATP